MFLKEVYFAHWGFWSIESIKEKSY